MLLTDAVPSLFSRASTLVRSAPLSVTANDVPEVISTPVALASV